MQNRMSPSHKRIGSGPSSLIRDYRRGCYSHLVAFDHVLEQIQASGRIGRFYLKVCFKTICAFWLI